MDLLRHTCCKLLSGVGGGAPAANAFRAYFAPNKHILEWA